MALSFLKEFSRSILGAFSPKPLFYWVPHKASYGIERNFGDEIFFLIVNKILGKNIRVVDMNYFGPKFIAGGVFIA